MPPTRTIREQPREYASQDVLAGVCAGVALRDLNLVDSLLAQLERMEAKEADPDELAELYRLDHLATRLRRNAENLRVLSGRDTGDAGSETQNLVDIIRAAMSSIEQYARVTIGRVVSLGVVGFAADDLGRLLSELLDNATMQSPPLSPVRVSAHLTEQGSVLLRIEDEGIGLPTERINALNSRLSSAPVLDRRSVQHMGLAVVGRLAHRHRMRVRLDRRNPNGTIASVLIPTSLVCDIPDSSWSGAQTVGYQQHTSVQRSSRIRGDEAGRSPGAPRIVPTSSAPISFAGRELRGQTVNGLPRRRPTADPGSPPSTDSPVVAPPPASPPVPEPSTSDTTAPGMLASDTTAPDTSAFGTSASDTSVSGTSATMPSAPERTTAASSGTTVNGLPRRIPRSLKNPSGRQLPPPRAFHELAQQAAEANHSQLIADLGAFTDGARAARERPDQPNDHESAHDHEPVDDKHSASDRTPTSEGHDQ